MQQNADHYKFIIQDFVKQSAPGRKQPELILPVFPADCRVCVYSVLSEYIKCTAASWKGDCTFRKFYNKPFVDDVSCFGQAVLGTSTAV